MPAAPASDPTAPTAPTAPTDPSDPRTVRALVGRTYGPPSGLELGDVPAPVAGPGQVVVRVAAAGMSRAALHLSTGRPLLLRLAGFGVRRPKQPVVGVELAGVVASVGEGVDDLQPGDEVFGYGRGTCAELAVAETAKLARIPDGVGLTEAAALVDSASTALQAVRDGAEVQAGQRVLVLGASGGVGTFAVQFAVTAGAIVTGTASAAKAELVRELGAHEVLDHTTVDPLDVARPYDAIIDIGGNRPIRRLRRALAADGALVLVGGEGGGAITGGFQRQVLAPLRAVGSRQRVRAQYTSEDRATLEAVAAAVVEGTVRPAIDRVHPLAEGARALERMAAGEIRGKDVVAIGAPPSL